MGDTDKLVAERGQRYGSPLENHSATYAMYNIWYQRGGALAPDAIKVCVFNICQKLSRAGQSPTYRDHWDDVAGYAQNALMVLDELQDINNE